MERTKLARAVADLVQRLPVLPETVERLLVADPDRLELDCFAELARKDATFCAQLLFLANSQCYTSPSLPAAETVGEALSRVDIEAVQMLVCTTLVGEQCQQRLARDAMWKEFVAHSRAIARSARILAELKGLPENECEKYAVAGLTHDIGRAVLMIAARPENASMIGTPPERMAGIIQNEQQAFGLNHCIVGEHLFRRWGFSQILQHGIRRHHTPLLDDDFSHPGAIIFVSHFVTMSDFTGAILSQMLGPELLGRMDLASETLDAARRLYLTRAGG